jgi:hypothetical protein
MLLTMLRHFNQRNSYADTRFAWVGLLPGARFIISLFLNRFTAAVVTSLVVVCLLVILRVLLRNQKAAIVAFIAIVAMVVLRQEGLAGALIFSILGCFLALRFSLVASASWYFTLLIIEDAPITLQASAWYSPYSYLVLTIFAAIILYAFRFSLGSRPLLPSPHLDD